MLREPSCRWIVSVSTVFLRLSILSCYFSPSVQCANIKQHKDDTRVRQCVSLNSLSGVYIHMYKCVCKMYGRHMKSSDLDAVTNGNGKCGLNPSVTFAPVSLYPRYQHHCITLRCLCLYTIHPDIMSPRCMLCQPERCIFKEKLDGYAHRHDHPLIEEARIAVGDCKIQLPSHSYPSFKHFCHRAKRGVDWDMVLFFFSLF